MSRSSSREELGLACDKLKNEIEELEREGDEIKSAWKERRQVLNDVVSEAGRLRRVVRGEPEHGPTEPDDGDADSEAGSHAGDDGEGDPLRREDEEDGLLQVQEMEDVPFATSNAGTPRPMDLDVPTPLPNLQESSGGHTPRSAVADIEVIVDPPP